MIQKQDNTQKSEAPVPAISSTASPQEGAPAKPLWKKVFNAALYVSTALIAPVTFERGKIIPRLSLGKLAVFLATPMMVMPLAANLFPTAEEVLAQKGYPAALVEELAPGRGNIRVRPDNVFGHAHALFSAPLVSSLMGRNSGWDHLQMPSVMGFAQLGRGLQPHTVYVADRKLRAHHSAGEPFMPMSYEDKWLHTFLHEVRHVSAQNAALPTTLAREADCDYEAARVMEERLGYTDFRAQIIEYKGGRFPETHDTVLYLSARFNGQTPPAAEDMAHANREAQTAVDRLNAKGGLHMLAALDCHISETPLRPCNYTIDGEPMSALGKQRLGLYFNRLLALMAVPAVPTVGPAAGLEPVAEKQDAAGTRKTPRPPA